MLISSCEVIVVEPAYDERDLITGSWEMEEFSETYNYSLVYDIYISKSNSTYDGIRINNLYDVDVTVRAYVQGDRIIIPQQVVNSYEISGVGTIRSDRITFKYTVYDMYYGGLTDYLDAIAW